MSTNQGDYLKAAGCYQVSYSLREEFDDAEGMTFALMHLGEVALRMEPYLDAQQSSERAMLIYEEIYDNGGLAAALNLLSRTAVAYARTLGLID